MRVIEMRRSRDLGQRQRLSVHLSVALLALGLVVWAGCGSVTSGPARVATSPKPTHTPPSTPTTAATCLPQELTPVPPGVLPSFPPLPPGTMSGWPQSASGAGFTQECTPGATEASITAFLNAQFAQAGWQRWNPQVNTAQGCAEPNTYWLWFKGDTAIGWSFPFPLPTWMIAGCNLAWGR